MQQKGYSNVICRNDVIENEKCVFTKDKMYSGRTMLNRDNAGKIFVRSIQIADNYGYKWCFNMHRFENGIPIDITASNGFGHFFYSKEEWRVQQIEKIF